MNEFRYSSPAACANCKYFDAKPVLPSKKFTHPEPYIYAEDWWDYTCKAKDSMKVDPGDICNFYEPNKGEEDNGRQDQDGQV